ncbi:hypothetical protein BJP36_43300 [Moorena producens JHB]|uniref:Uncharacterized protein n=1 Tax=Moorena producens (strain JHB) TaxID=1454205 RepID=A0A9Q9ST56_MOOP1|nr:hypothetical protein [Moorena producens]WAN69190.1 hypothetical protein BJP36_43300 [Moorena producens JHB]
MTNEVPPAGLMGVGSRESGAVRPVANLITGQAHRGSRESGVAMQSSIGVYLIGNKIECTS